MDENKINKNDVVKALWLGVVMVAALVLMVGIYHHENCGVEPGETWEFYLHNEGDRGNPFRERVEPAAVYHVLAVSNGYVLYERGGATNSCTVAYFKIGAVKVNGGAK